ncbi:hypothetical protein [Dyadobacter bucti]|uniref:hypothetical protein n=1 Tax=Dyadobacter bucti TaxID=2572203 RepID=UPI001E45D2CD|nr:hypothetical protein [Dyadobacter bucti]
MDLEDYDFLQFTRCAQEQNLEYMVVGGFALYLHGLNRATNDVDIWINPTQANGERLISVFRCMELDEVELIKLSLLDFTKPQIFGFEGTLDIMTQVHHRFDFSELFKRSRKFKNPHGSVIHFLHLNDLRELKILARGRKTFGM